MGGNVRRSSAARLTREVIAQQRHGSRRIQARLVRRIECEVENHPQRHRQQHGAANAEDDKRQRSHGVVQRAGRRVLRRMCLVEEPHRRSWVPTALAYAERVYSERRDTLVEALAAQGFEAWGRSGLNVWVPVNEESVAVASLLAAGYAVAPGERFRLASGPGVRITTATLEPGEAPAVAEALARAVGGRRRTYSA